VIRERPYAARRAVDSRKRRPRRAIPSSIRSTVGWLKLSRIPPRAVLPSKVKALPGTYATPSRYSASISSAPVSVPPGRSAQTSAPWRGTLQRVPAGNSRASAASITSRRSR